MKYAIYIKTSNNYNHWLSTETIIEYNDENKFKNYKEMLLNDFSNKSVELDGCDIEDGIFLILLEDDEWVTYYSTKPFRF